jgi:hypothetical protein
VTSPHDDLPRSKSGRTPQWVKDEAEGRPTTPVAWRAPPSTFGPGPGQRRSVRVRNALVTAAVFALIGGAAVWSWTGHSSAPAADAPTSAATPATKDPGPRFNPPPGLEEAAAPVGTPAPLAATSESFKFKATQPGSRKSPVTFSPCRPIHYVVRPDHAPTGGDTIIARAVTAVAMATGLHFVFDGPTTEALVPEREPYQPDLYGDKWAPVLIAWATADEVPDFGTDIDGEASTQQVRHPDGQLTYVTGDVYLGARAAVRMQKRGNERGVQAVVEHELGHLVGLAHVNDKHQLMYPRETRGVFTYGDGDLSGLSALGRGSCAADI